MVDRSRKTVEYAATSVDIEYGTLADARDTIDYLIKTYGADARIDYYQNPYEDHRTLSVFAKRPETDNEYNLRVSREESYEKIVEERERTEFERLSKKFGSN
jgi:hypothetical protein